MKIEKRESEDSHEVFIASFEQSSDNGLHEAYVALNAIAARNRKTFDETFGTKVEQPDKLAEATSELLESGADRLVAEIQRLGREKSRESILTESLKLKATKDNLKYLHGALIGYRDDTSMAVTSEMRNAMGNQAGLTRTFEMVTADAMVHEISNITGISHGAAPDRQPIGFARVLLSSHEA